MDKNDEIVNAVTKKKRNRPDLANFGEEFVEPGDNAKYVEFALASFSAPAIDTNDPQQLQERIVWYFNRCISNDMKPGIVGLANALGVSRQTLWNWKTGERGKTMNPACVDLIKKAYNFIEEMLESYMLNGKVSPPNGIFLLKNHFNYRDQTDVVVTPNNPLDNLNVDEARKRLTESIPDGE